MAQDKVQLKREEVVGNDVVLQDINPKTKTNSITDSAKGVPLDQTLALIKNMINNKLARVVNSVNGKTGIVILDANDVGLGNVDNISFGDIKRWVIEYLGDIFGSKRIILRDYLSQIHDILGTNDKIYADTPFYAQAGDATNNDFIAYIGYIYWDETTSSLSEEHKEVKVIGFTDESLVYNTNCDIDPYHPDDHRNLSGGGLAVNIWSKEDALKIRRAEGLFTRDGYDPAVLNDTGLYIDKSKVVPNVYFFDGVYGTLTGEGANMHNIDALVYWSNDPHDTTESNLPILNITINGQAIGMTSTAGGDPVYTLHHPSDLPLKVGDIILTNFAFDQYINPDDASHRENVLYPRMLDSLTCRQPCLGVVKQAADTTNDTPCIIDFKPQRPNVGRGLKLIITDSAAGVGPEDSEIGLDLMEGTITMGDGTNIDSNDGNNVSGINAIDKHDPISRSARSTQPKHLYTVYPTGKSADLIGGSIDVDSSFILPNFSMCIIPAALNKASDEPAIKNWNPTSPMTNTHAGEVLGNARKFNMLGVNLAKVIMDTNVGDDDHAFARNVSGLRVNTSDDSFDDEWYGYGSGIDTIPNYLTSGGISVNVGDFLGIGTPTELSGTPAEKGSYYNEGKVNVRIDRMQGLNGVAGNRLAVNIAGGYSYAPEGVTHNWLEGGLTFVDGGTRAPAQGVLAVNTAEEASGLGIKNSYRVNVRHTNWDNRIMADTCNNVLVVKPAKFTESSAERAALTKSGLEVHKEIQEEDFANKITFTNIYNQRMWLHEGQLHDDIVQNPSNFDTTHIYIAGGKRFIYAEPQGQQTEISLFMYYSDSSEYNAILTWIRTGNDSDVPNATWPIHGYTLTPNEHTTANDECLAILRRQCHVLIKEEPSALNGTRYRLQASISEPTTSAELRFPDLDHDGNVDATEASSVLAYCSFLAVSTSVYSTTVGGQKVFYTDPGLTTPLVPVEGRGYIDKNDYHEDRPENPGHTYYMPYNAVKDPGSDIVYLKKYEFDPGRTVTLQDVMYADVDRSGAVNVIDASRILTYYSNCSSGKYSGMTPEESWREYLRDAMGIIVGSGTREVYQVLDMIYDPGVRVRYNEQKGLTTFPNYFGNTAYDTRTLMENDMKDALSIKIADTTSGMFEFDPATAGGLRFGSNGYLAVRINNNNHYSSILPIKNNPAHIDDLSTGSRGLRIYNTDNAFNVLGVQLSSDGSLDNGELKIDANGCLRLSGAIRPDVKKLKFKCGAQEVEYDGNDEVTIEFGPGMIVTEHHITSSAQSQHLGG